MAVCSCRPLVKRDIDVYSEPYETSYKRSYFYENVTDHPFINVRVNRRARDDLKVQDPVVLKTLESVYNANFVPKYLEGCYSSTDFYRRSSFASRGTLKCLDEKYIADPPRPLKIGSSTTGSSYVTPEKFHESKTWRQPSPIEQFTCSIPSHCKEGLSSFSPNESGYTKYLDPYMTTSQSTHCAFDEMQQNGVAKKNIMTIYDAIGLPKNRGFGPKRLEHFGSYFDRDQIIPGRVRPKIISRVPFFGKTSTYRARYDFVPTNLMHREEEVNYPGVFKSIEDSSYCTEQCHMGTGWPVRGAVDIGTVRGTH